ncbi:hypothetical protein CkaCkLH20_07154 [Colletotrichum karsti]|uniref:Uncharacterized protein n=1 Tax=Colletotrichum karsti TaxID=1095194 RepID=A0A9P6I3F7_9PEZI|nr:uncharacterized protein CkaCkLH20_07154 [Colletotrichum karsti]KAF9875334.1 hypothetical protein CkaCkLH20_07154 [Colletotrichum karsti]
MTGGTLAKPEPMGHARNDPGTNSEGYEDFLIEDDVNLKRPLKEKKDEDLDDWEIVSPKVKTKYYTANYVQNKMRKVVAEVEDQYEDRFEAMEKQQEALLMLIDRKGEIEESLRQDLAQRTLENQRLKARIAHMEAGEVFTEKLKDISLGEVDD